LAQENVGQEFAIAAQRLGNYVIAVTAMRMRQRCKYDCADVISMLSAEDLERVLLNISRILSSPDSKAIRTEKLLEFEQRESR
jgi:phosphoribosylglycinamide formyltransferase 2